MTFQKVTIARLLRNPQILHLQLIYCKQANPIFLIPEELYKQHCSQKMHALSQLQNSNWFTEKNK